ncbi:hypothetical protein DB88DRAFT_525546 [Papiliotrema laurentii]|uniref:Zn(2)-C6 fungal-type domain-containing protein n=1 Tax=Papiliotrema laurentii TaxID=5418 RepID=A0AAD9L5Z5_PAPLA|nr:hypothetical protein DB88DRAFT_525546 [Papiliotrema laurentii]
MASSSHAAWDKEDRKPSVSSLGLGENGVSAGSRGGDALKREVSDSGEKRKRVKRVKRSTGKACVYCRRSHMVCEGGRPCERCVKREIAHLCRDVTPPASQSDSKRTKSPSHPPEAELSIQPAAQLRAHPQPPTPVSQSSAIPVPGLSNTTPNTLPTSLYSDPNFPPAWPLLPDAAGPVTFGDGSGSNDGRTLGAGGMEAWRQGDDTELGALTKFLGDLGVPSLPGGFLDVLSYFSRGGTGETDLVTGTNLPVQTLTNNPLPNPTPVLTNDNEASLSVLNSTAPSNGSTAPVSRVESNLGSTSAAKGKAKEVSFVTPQLSNISRIEKYFLAAADQPSGPRASRLAQVIKAKYDAGLLKPYDYIKGYERMNKWMDSGRAAPKADSVQGSAPPSPQRGAAVFGRARLVSATPASTYGASISPESRRRILTALNGFRPKFRQIARTLTDVDLVFVEEAMERWMLEYDRAFASIHTPSCIWRRTGEIQKANQEFANLTGIPASMFRNGILCVYELMDEDSAVRYWEGYAKIAFDAGQRSLTTHCTLKVPMSLIRSRASRPSNTPGSLGTKPAAGVGQPPDFSLPQPLITTNIDMPSVGLKTPDSGIMAREEFREIKCCFSVTIRRDAWGVPVAIMGQWIPI